MMPQAVTALQGCSRQLCLTTCRVRVEGLTSCRPQHASIALHTCHHGQHTARHTHPALQALPLLPWQARPASFQLPPTGAWAQVSCSSAVCIASGDRSGNLAVWSLGGAAKALWSRAGAHKGHITALTCLDPAPSGLSFVSGGQDGCLRTWDARWVCIHGGTCAQQLCHCAVSGVAETCRLAAAAGCNEAEHIA